MECIQIRVYRRVRKVSGRKPKLVQILFLSDIEFHTELLMRLPRNMSRVEMGFLKTRRPVDRNPFFSSRANE